MEIESALVAHPSVAEAAVVGMPHELKGQGIAAFVSLQSGQKPSEQLKQDLIGWVGKQIGSLAKPDQIRFSEALPKTRSAKVLRRAIRAAALDKPAGDLSSLEDPASLDAIRQAT